jgi:hypothetical protein
MHVRRPVVVPLGSSPFVLRAPKGSRSHLLLSYPSKNANAGS